MNNIFESYCKHLQQGVPSVFLPPTLIRHGEDYEGDVKFCIPYHEFIDRLSGKPVAQTWFLRGSPGSGKTTLARSLAVDLLSRDTAALLLTARNLSQIPEPKANDIRDIVKSCRPNWMAGDAGERIWNARARKGHIVLIIDGINDLERWYPNSPIKNLVDRILLGSHPFPVVATSRRELEENYVLDAFRKIDRLMLDVFDDTAQRFYLNENGVDPNEGMNTLEAARLDELTGNPLLLHLATLLLAQGNSEELPRSRAGLFLRTVHHAEKSLTAKEKIAFEQTPSLTAIISAAAVIAALHPNLQGSFTRQELNLLLSRVWSCDNIATSIDAFLGCYLVENFPTPTSSTHQFIHDSIVDFGMAMVLRGGPPPLLALLPKTGLDNLLGDWVGLQDNIQDAVEITIAFAERHYAHDLLVDIVAAKPWAPR